MIDPKDYLTTFARGLEVIACFSHSPKHTVSSIAAQMEISRSAARRFLLTLEELGYADCPDGKHFTLTAKVLEFSYIFLSNLNYTDAIMPHLERLSLQLGELCSASVLDKDAIVYIACLPAQRRLPLALNLQIGARLPALTSSMGRVLLGGLPSEILDRYINEATLERYTPFTVTDKDQLRQLIDQAHQDGYAILDRELDSELRSLAVPVRDGFGRAQLALNIGCHSSAYSIKTIKSELLPALQQCASEIEQVLF